MQQSTLSFTLPPEKIAQRRKHRLQAWSGVVAVTLIGAGLVFVVTTVDMDVVPSPLIALLVGFGCWSVGKLCALSREADRIDLDDTVFRLHSFGKCRQIEYRDVGGLVSFLADDGVSIHYYVAELRSRSGSRLGRFSEDFPDFAVLYDELRRRLALAGVVVGDDGEARRVRLRRKRGATWACAGLCLLGIAVCLLFAAMLDCERREQEAFRERGRVAVARVTRHFRDFKPYLEINFTDERDVEHTLARSIEIRRWREVEVGDFVIVHYLADDPETTTFVIRETGGHIPLTAACLAVAALLIAGACMLLKGYCPALLQRKIILLRPDEVIEDRYGKYQ